MRRSPRFQLVQTTCKRCGKPIYTGNRSLFGLDEVFLNASSRNNS